MDIYVIILLIFLGVFTVMFTIITCAFITTNNQKEPRIKKGTTCEKCLYLRKTDEDIYRCGYFREEDIIPIRKACNHYEEREVYEPAYKD